MNKVFVNKQFVLQARDFLAAWYVAAGAPLVDIVIQWLRAWAYDEVFEIQWKPAIFTALTATIAFLGYRFFSPPKVVTTYTSNEQAKSVAEDIKKDYKLAKFFESDLYWVYEYGDPELKEVFRGTKEQCEKFINK